MGEILPTDPDAPGAMDMDTQANEDDPSSPPSPALLLEDLNHRLDAALRRLECPFTWNTPLMPSHQIRDITLINKGRMPMVWNEVIIKTKLAYTHCKKQRAQRGARYIVDAYTRLLPAFDDGDELVRDYFEALKHFVDGTWAHVCRQVCAAEEPDRPEALRDLAELVEGIKPAQSLDLQQRSALLIIRAKCEHYPESVPLARKAVDLYPDEGHWYCVLSKLLCCGRHTQLQLGDTDAMYSQTDQKKAAITAHEKRKTVESYLMLARVYQDTGFCSKAMEIMKEAVEAYPTSSWVLVEAAEMAKSLPKPQREMGSALRWMQRALDCPGGQCPYVAYGLGMLLLERGDRNEAQPHIARAAPYMEEAKELLDIIVPMRGSSTPLTIVRNPVSFFGKGLGIFRAGGTGGGTATIPTRSGRKRF